jgi:hypothetical protein
MWVGKRKLAESGTRRFQELSTLWLKVEQEISKNCPPYVGRRIYGLLGRKAQQWVYNLFPGSILLEIGV